MAPSVCRDTERNQKVRIGHPLVVLILFGEWFFYNFQSWEIIGDMYQYTEGVLSLFLRLSRSKNNKFAKFHVLWNEKNEEKMTKNEKLRETNVEIYGEKSLR